MLKITLEFEPTTGQLELKLPDANLGRAVALLDRARQRVLAQLLAPPADAVQAVPAAALGQLANGKGR